MIIQILITKNSYLAAISIEEISEDTDRFLSEIYLTNRYIIVLHLIEAKVGQEPINEVFLFWCRWQQTQVTILRDSYATIVDFLRQYQKKAL